MCVSYVFMALLEYALVNYAARADARALDVWRAAQKQMEFEQTETFDYKGNTGFEKRVKIHSGEFHETPIEEEVEEREEEREEERDTASERQWETEQDLERREGREYRNYNYETEDYIDNREVDWGDQREHYDRWGGERRRGYSQGYHYQEEDWREDYYYGHYGYQRWRDHYDDGYRHHTNRRWSYDSYYDKVPLNTKTTINLLSAFNVFIVKQIYCFI